MRILKDSRGKKSWTHTLAIPAMMFATLRFILGGMTLPIPNYPLVIPAWDIATYIGFSGLWMAYLGQREYIDKTTAS